MSVIDRLHATERFSDMLGTDHGTLRGTSLKLMFGLFVRKHAKSKRFVASLARISGQFVPRGLLNGQFGHEMKFDFERSIGHDNNQGKR